jgi:hypothetical protein
MGGRRRIFRFEVEVANHWAELFKAALLSTNSGGGGTGAVI